MLLRSGAAKWRLLGGSEASAEGDALKAIEHTLVCCVLVHNLRILMFVSGELLACVEFWKWRSWNFLGNVIEGVRV